MANESILISEVIPASPQRIFSAWLDSAEHSAFTGSQASVVPSVGGDHTAWDGYVQGRTLELHDGSRIVQSWRTTEFPADSPDSRLEITLEPTVGGTLVTLLHTDIPSGQSDRYREGWNQYYLSRMKTYFAESGEASDDDMDEDEPTMPLGRTSSDFEATEVVTQFSSVDDDEPTQETSEATSEETTDVTTEAKTKKSKPARQMASKPASKPAAVKASKAGTGTVGKALRSARKSALKMAARFVKKATALTAKSRGAKKSPTKTAAKRVVKTAAKRTIKRASSKKTSKTASKAASKKSSKKPGKSTGKKPGKR